MWYELIPQCFGEIDLEFALHPSEEKKAMEMLVAANNEGASPDEICKEIKKFLTKKKATNKHIASQLKKVRKFIKKN